MNTTSDDDKRPEWSQWGKEGEEPPQFKEYIELLLKFNNQSREILQDTREWLKQQHQSGDH